MTHASTPPLITSPSTPSPPPPSFVPRTHVKNTTCSSSLQSSGNQWFGSPTHNRHVHKTPENAYIKDVPHKLTRADGPWDAVCAPRTSGNMPTGADTEDRLRMGTRGPVLMKGGPGADGPPTPPLPPPPDCRSKLRRSSWDVRAEATPETTCGSLEGAVGKCRVTGDTTGMPAAEDGRRWWFPLPLPVPPPPPPPCRARWESSRLGGVSSPTPDAGDRSSSTFAGSTTMRGEPRLSRDVRSVMALPGPKGAIGA